MTTVHEIEKDGKGSNPLFIIPLFFMSILLHQSSVIFGVNFSLADFFCFFLFLILMMWNQFYIPIQSMLFFILVFIVVLVSAVFFVPIIFSYTPEPTRIISDFMKLLAIFLYFLVGYNLLRMGKITISIKWYSIIGLIIGLIGVLFTLLNIRLFSSVLFFLDIRFKGFMNDPNYFSVLQVTALVYFTRVKTIPLRFKYFAILILILSVLVSGSKTGIITLFSYFFIRIIEYTLISKEKKTKKIILQLSLIFALLAIAFIIIRGFPTLLNMLSSAVPAFSRIEPLFTDFDEAISGNGSDRADTWKVAYLIIQHSPLIGTGIGSYTHIAAETFYYNNVAHNTFLQITAEWGIPLAVLFFTFIGRLIVKSSNSRKSNFEMNYILRDILIILLIGSMAISLNNARVLWLVIGALLSSLGKKQTQRSLK